MDQEQCWGTLATKQVVQGVVFSHSSHVQQISSGRRREAGIQLHRQLKDRETSRTSNAECCRRTELSFYNHHFTRHTQKIHL